jgi:HK97 family phage major capsid protein
MWLAPFSVWARQIEHTTEERTMKNLLILMPLFPLMLLNAITRGDMYADANGPEAIQALQDKLVGLNEEAVAIQAKADAEKRELTEDEETELTTILDEFDRVEATLKRRSRMAAQAGRIDLGEGRQTTADGDDDAAAGANSPNYRTAAAGDRGRWGWRTFGEYAGAVHAASRPGAIPDDRIQNAPTTTGNEGAGADGGFAVPPDFRGEIMRQVMGEESLLSRTDQMQVSGNSMTFPRDETTPWGSTGIQANWEGEGDQGAQSKAALDLTQIRLNKLMCLVPMTDELLEDAPAMTSYLNSKVPEVFTAKVNTAIVNGSGAGQPRGILNGGDLITVAKESGQTADTIVFENIVKMYSRMLASARTNSVWLINQDIEPQLMSLGFPSSATAVPVWLPPGGLASSPHGTLMGRPVIPIEACQTLGDAGDIILTNMSKYLTIMKTGGVRSDVSIHLWFDFDTTAFRFIFRMAGQPHFNSTVTPQNGSNTRAHNVTLAARA